MSAGPWFRWYVGTSEDGKLRVTARHADVTVVTVLGVWAKLLEDAAHADHRGVSRRGHAYHCAILEIEEAKMRSILEGMEAVGMVKTTPDGVVITHWAERQFETDVKDPTAAERKRRQRQRQAGKNGTNGHGRVTNGHGEVTVTTRPEADTEQNQKQNLKKENHPLPLKERKPGATSTAGKGYVWIVTDDPRWPVYAKAWREGHDGKDPPRIAGLGGMGWHFEPLEEAGK